VELKIIPVVQVLIAALLMFLITKLMPMFNYLSNFSYRIVTLLLFFAALIGILAIYCFRINKTTVDPRLPEKASTVVDSGIYRYSRNPMYLALLLVLLSIAFSLQNIMTFLIIPLFIFYITRYQIIAEERMLITLFGEDYKLYCRKVRRWL